MKLPISANTVLNNRYQIIRVLGQGGFGRTYLAADKGRFDELCALKELIPNQELDKSQELFQREASTLYKIDHPQVPKFRATFEEDERFFLVQDYVEGKTYRELLEERKAEGKTFSEAEIKQFLQQLLPILDHIHNQGIIHRDLSPDNIILRQGDSLPVLIDFGVVKELATRIQGIEGTQAATTVGKIGFAPSEQIQMGRSYPNSDLYALAVTAVVLLTGKEPRDLFDSDNLTWHWRRYSTINDSFAQVINKMLSYRPGDRYQSTPQVQQALENPSLASPSSPDYELSRLATVAVSRQAEDTQQTLPPNRTAAVIPSREEDPPGQNPWAFLGLTAFLVTISGLGAYSIFSAMDESSPPVETPAVVEPVEPEAVEPEIVTQGIQLSPGNTFAERGSLDANTTLNYVFAAEEGQQLQAILDSEGVWMTILQPDGSLVTDATRRIQSWDGTFPRTGDYTVQLTPIPGLSQTDYRYRLSLSLEAAPTPIPEEIPTPIPEEPTPTPPETPVTPRFQSQPLQLSADQDPQQLTGTTSPENIKRYVVNLREGQRLKGRVVAGNVGLTPRFLNGEAIPDIGGVSSFEFDVTPLLGGGRYSVDVVSEQETEFTIELGIVNIAQETPGN